jgi:arginine/lysine/ornithine decarboxylase
MGGTAFQKSPVGSIFYDFFGSNTMKSDISISVSELGSCWTTAARTKKRKSISLASLTPNAAIW